MSPPNLRHEPELAALQAELDAIGARYQAEAMASEPGADVDARILAAAHRAVGAGPVLADVTEKAGRVPRARRWGAPLGLAASIILSLSVGLAVWRNTSDRHLLLPDKTLLAQQIVPDAGGPPEAAPASAAARAGTPATKIATDRSSAPRPAQIPRVAGSERRLREASSPAQPAQPAGDALLSADGLITSARQAASTMAAHNAAAPPATAAPPPGATAISASAPAAPTPAAPPSALGQALAATRYADGRDAHGIPPPGRATLEDALRVALDQGDAAAARAVLAALRREYPDAQLAPALMPRLRALGIDPDADLTRPGP